MGPDRQPTPDSAGAGVTTNLTNTETRDIEVTDYIYGKDLDPKATGLYLVDTAILVPSVSDSDYVNNILNIIIENQIDFYFPGTDMELMICAENKDLIEKESGCKVHVSPEQVIKIGNDKYHKNIIQRCGKFAPEPASPLP